MIQLSESCPNLSGSGLVLPHLHRGGLTPVVIVVATEPLHAEGVLHLLAGAVVITRLAGMKDGIEIMIDVTGIVTEIVIVSVNASVIVLAVLKNASGISKRIVIDMKTETAAKMTAIMPRTVTTGKVSLLLYVKCRCCL